MNRFSGGRKCFMYLNKRTNPSASSDLYVIKDIEMMKCECSIKPTERVNHVIDMTRLLVKVLAKKNDATIHDISNFLKEKVNKNYFFALQEGWMGLDVAVDEKRRRMVFDECGHRS